MFVYCGNNSANFIDPTGFCTCIGTRLSFVDCGSVDCPESKNYTFDNSCFSLPNKKEHYSRNRYNPSFPLEYDAEFFKGWDDSVAVNCHQFTAENRDNVKYVSPDGMYEVIYDVDGKLVFAPEDVGTYNYVSPNKSALGHFIKDVLPWIIYGNSPEDSTDWWQRTKSLVKIYD